MSIELRPLSLDDVDLVHRITVASERGDETPYVTTAEEVRERFAAPGFDPALSGRVALLDGEAVGVAYVAHSPSGERLEVANLVGYVDPRWRRRGVGTALLSWEVERGREIMGSYDHGLPCHLRTYHFVDQTDAVALAEGLGFAPVRWFDQLARPLGAPLDVPTPQGIEIHTWEPALESEVLDVRNAAFADHWGSTAKSAETFGHWVHGSTIRQDLSFMARRDGKVVGYSLNEHFPDDTEVTGHVDGWISNLGVLKGERGRGIASALMAASVESFRAAGFERAMLDVDSASPSNAHELYRRLGFELLRTEVAHEITVG